MTNLPQTFASFFKSSRLSASERAAARQAWNAAIAAAKDMLLTKGIDIEYSGKIDTAINDVGLLRA